MSALNFKSFAKINLGLQVLNKRPDAYHNINTLFSRIDLFDEISIEESNSMEIYCQPDLGIAQEENLVYKALKKYLDKINSSTKFKVHIKKNIPHGGGLGGGSSNAAYALIAASHILKHQNESTLKIIAQSIGSDLPYFLQEGKATALSRGEVLSYFQLDLDYSVLIVNPGIHVSTPEAYKNLNRGESSKAKIDFKMILEKSISNPSLLKEFIINDFEKTVFQSHPEIKNIKEDLYNHGALLSLMSGSGSTVFGLFQSKEEAQSASNIFPQYYNYVSNLL